MTDFGGKTSIFSHPVYLFLREFSLQDFRGGSDLNINFIKLL
ncbi:transposase [Escherichia coli]|nr:transposase [Escherichia coli]